MDIYQQIQKFEELIDYVENQLPKFAEQVSANDLVALITNRVVQKGEDYQGRKFLPYSSKTVAAWRFWGKSRTQAAEKKIRTLARAKGALSYEEFRSINGLNTNVKNFQFTGEMWRKFGVVRSSTNGTNFRITLGGTTTASQEKIDDNSEREAISIIEANEDEINMVEEAIQSWLERETQRILEL